MQLPDPSACRDALLPSFKPTTLHTPHVSQFAQEKRKKLTDHARQRRANARWLVLDKRGFLSSELCRISHGS